MILRGLDVGKKSGSDAISRRSRDGTNCTKVESWVDRETSGDTFEDARLGRWFKLVLEACRSEYSLDEGSACGELYSTAHTCRRVDSAGEAARWDRMSAGNMVGAEGVEPSNGDIICSNRHCHNAWLRPSHAIARAFIRNSTREPTSVDLPVGNANGLGLVSPGNISSNCQPCRHEAAVAMVDERADRTKKRWSSRCAPLDDSDLPVSESELLGWRQLGPARALP